MIKILLNETRIILADDIQECYKEYAIKNALIVFRFTPENATDLIDILLISETQYLLVIGDEQINVEVFKNALPYVRAGGGVVFNSKRKILFI